MTQDGKRPPLDFSSYIVERTRDFTGREWVFAEIDQWLANTEAPRYFLIIGEPGIGKTAITTRLTQLYTIAAAHFCIARQADTLDPVNFARSISYQLAHVDGFAQCLVEESGIHVQASINVQRNYGQIAGVRIERLITESNSGIVAFIRAVVAPLKQLCADGFERQLVILVDALDEAVQYQGSENIVDLLASSQGLPPNVRFVLTSRPDSTALRHFEEQHIPHLAIDAGQDENLLDVRKYIQGQISRIEALQARLAEEGVPPETFIERVLSTSHGNFLYLVWMLSAIIAGTQRLDTLDVLPEGLDGIYREFLRTRMVGKDVNQWRIRYRPLLGILAVAQTALTVDHLMQFTGLSKQTVRDTLQDIEQFLDPNLGKQKRYQLYHQSITDFISSEERAQEFWVELESMHRKIATYYLEHFAPLWHGCDSYGLRYLLTHLVEAGQFEVLRKLLLDRGWLDVQHSYDPSLHIYIQGIDRVLEMAETKGKEGIPDLVAWSLLHGTVISQSANLPITAMEAMIVLGDVEQALHYADLLTVPERKAEAYLKIGLQLQEQGSVLQAMEVLARARTVAKSIRREGWRAINLSNVAQAMNRIGEKEQAQQTMMEALAVAESIEHERQRVEVLSDMVQGIARIGNSDQAQKILSQILAMAKEMQDIWLMSHLIKTISLIEDIEHTHQIINDTLSMLAGIDNEREFVRRARPVAGVLIEIGRVEQAAEIINHAITIVKDFEDQGARDPDLRFLIAELARMEAYDQALLLTKDIETEREHALALSSIALALAKNRAFDRALKIVKNIKEGWVHDEALREIAQALAQDGMFGRALTVAEGIEDELECGRALGAIALALAQKKETEQAKHTIDRVRSKITFSDDRVHQAQALSEIALALAKTGAMEQALTVWSQSILIAKRISYEWYRFKVLNTVAIALAEAGPEDQTHQIIDEALRDAEKMRKELRSSALSKVAINQALKGEKEQARQTVDRALELAKAMQSNFDCMRALNNVAECLNHLGEVEQARQILYQALSVAKRIGERDYRAWALSEVTFVLIDVGDKEQARQTLTEALPLARGDDRALSHVALGFAKLGEVDRALSVASEVSSKHEASIAFHGVVQALLQQGNLNKALSVTNSMIDDLFGERAQAFCDVVEYLIKVKDIKQAQQVLVQALTTAENIEVADWRPFALQAFSEQLIQILQQGDTEIIRSIKMAFRAARSRGRTEVWLHIEAFAKILGKLSVIEVVWTHIQEVEALWKQEKIV